MAGFVNRNPLSGSSSKKSVGSWLKKLSSFGMEYDDMVITNSHAIGISEDEMGWTKDPTTMFGGEYDEYRMFANLALSDVSMRKNISVFNKQYPKKREELRQFAQQDKIEDVLETIADEAIVPDDKNFFAYPTIFDSDFLEDKISEKIRDSINTNYKKIYQYFGFNDEGSAWSYFKKWLTDGYLAFEIIYDNSEKNIIGFKELDTITLEPSVESGGKRSWIQFKGDPAKERTLYDSQIIYISYSNINSPGRESYVERLVRTFNILRIMEHSRVIWAVVNSSFKTKFLIPVGGKSKTRAKQSLSVLMQSYREVMDFDVESGELKVNGKPMMPFNKEYWLPTNDAGSPEIDTVGNEGPDLSDTDSVRYFREEFYKTTKIPLSRFDQESPPSWDMNAEGSARDEIKFSRFINRLRSTFQEILLKPLWIQTVLEFPELAEDDNFKFQIGLKFQKLNMFDEMKELEVLQKKIEFIDSAKESLIDTDEDMNEESFFSSEFLVRKFLGLSEEDLRLNKKYKLREKKSLEAQDDDDDI